MRVEIKIEPDIREPVAVIHAPKMNRELTALVEMLEQTGGKPALLFVKSDDKLHAVKTEQIDIIRTEGSDIKLYNREAQEFVIARPLHELQERLGASFVRISKSTIINIDRIDHLSPSFDRTMYVAMENGIGEYISRSYLNDVKKRLGL